MGLPLRWASIHMAAIERNLRVIQAGAGDADLFVDVSADAYGHGARPVARAAMAAGAHGLVVATIGEGIALRTGGVDAPILAWQHPAGEEFALAAEYRITPVVSSPAQLAATGAAAAARSGVATVLLAAAIGESVVGCREQSWRELVDAAAQLGDGTRVTGILGFPKRQTPHARDDLRDIRDGQRELEGRVALAREAGLTPLHTGVDGSAAVLAGALGSQNTVIVGRAAYGVSPFRGESARDLGLTPAMRLSARVIATKPVGAGEGVSYGYTYRTSAPTTLALVGIGYVHGVDRAAGNRCTAWLNGATYPIAGRIAMDVLMLDLGGDTARAGDEVVLFGDSGHGHPSVEKWAAAIGRETDEVVTGITARVVRSYS